MNPFEIALPGRVLFGRGKLREAGRLAALLGQRALVVTGGSTRRAAPLLASLAESRVQAEVFAVTGEPTTCAVVQGAQLAREGGRDLVIGCGGGSAMDAGKAIAAMARNPGDLLDYLEVIGAGKPIAHSPLPIMALPSTAGTGAEVTRNAVLSSPAHRVKVSLRSPLLLPTVAIIDPELTYSLPPAITATSGMDALTQLIEAFVSPRANPLTDSLCRDGIARAASALPLAFAQALEGRGGTPAPDPRQMHAREEMALVSLWSGIALANAGLGAVHGLAGPIGGMFDAPHGAICASLLAEVMRTNIQALRRRAPSDPALERYQEIARIIMRSGTATAEESVGAIQRLAAQLHIAPLGAYGVGPRYIPDLVANAHRASSMKANPLVLTTDELTRILQRSIVPGVEELTS